MLTPFDPFVPDPDQARRLLLEELSHAEYQEGLFTQIVQKVLDIFKNLFGNISSPTFSISTFWLLACLALAVIGLIVFLIIRLRRNPQKSAENSSQIFSDHKLTAAEHRELAHQAIQAKDYDTAIVEITRAVATNGMERELVPDNIGITVHEVAEILAAKFPDQQAAIRKLSYQFDAIRFGDRHANAQQAAAGIELEKRLQSATPETSHGPIMAAPR